MMRDIVTGLGIAAIAIAIAGGVYVSAQNAPPQGARPGMGRGGPGGPGGRGFGGPMGDLGLGPLFRLDLTDAQHQQLKTILDAHRDELQALRDREAQARSALHAAIAAEPFDEGMIRSRSADAAVVDADFAVTRAKLRREVLQILTPEQRTQAQQFQNEMKQRAERRRQRQGQTPPAVRQ
jgi:protein CpxP